MARAFGLSLALLLAGGAAGAAEPPAEPLTRLYYDRELLAYCGLGDAGARAGFERRLRDLRERPGFSRERQLAAQSRAWQAAHAEWQNRGLGGFRGWCREEGRAAAARFLEPGAKAR